jgi:hypothetical protein
MSSNFNCSYMARSSLTYIPFLAHLVFRPCELLPSLFVRPSTFHILIFYSETTGPIATKLWWNGPWVAPPWKLCPVILTSKQDGRQTKNRKKGYEILKKIFSSETTESISTKLCWNDPWVVPFQNYVRHFRPPTKMATTTELNLT